MSPWRAVASALVLVAALAMPSGGVRALPVNDVSAPTTAPDTVASSEPLRTPAEVVAARARALLRDHADRRAWGELAITLPGVAAGVRESEAIAEATRVAVTMREAAPHESGAGDPSTAPVVSPQDAVVSSPPVAASSPPTTASSPPAGAGDRRSLGEMIDVLASALALLLGVFALAMVVKGAGSALRPATSTSSASSDRGLHREARVMAARGMQAHEIARRTGLARDAVSVLLDRKTG